MPKLETARDKIANARGDLGANVRTPFVDMYIGGNRINLQGGRQFSGKDVKKAFADATSVSPHPLFLLDFTYSVTNGVSVTQEATITILDPNWDYLEGLLAQSVKAQRSISFNYGWRGIHDKSLGNLSTGLLLKNFTVSYLPFQGAKISLVVVDKGVVLSYSRLGLHFPSTHRIDQVIKSAIESSDPDLEAVVETMSQQVGTEHNQMYDLSTMEYVQHLLSIAKGKGSVQDGVPTNSDFVMRTEAGDSGKTRIVISSDVPRRSVVANYVVGREVMGEMIEFSPQVMGSIILSLGGGKQVGIGVDPETKSVRKVMSTHLEDQPRTGDVTVHPVSAQPNQYHQLPFSSLADIEGFTKGNRATIDKNQFPATAVVLGNPLLKPLDQINVVVLKSNASGAVDQVTDRSLATTSGVYRILEVEHIISAGMFRSNLTLYRESGFIGAGELGIRLAINLDPTGALRHGFEKTKATVTDIADDLF